MHYFYETINTDLYLRALGFKSKKPMMHLFIFKKCNSKDCEDRCNT